MLAGCGGIAERVETAQSIAAPAKLERRTVDAGPFALTVFERIGRPGEQAHVYIEGDGFAWLDRVTPSGDPTPKDPVGLRLAAADDAPNVIYIARPCQYSGLVRGQACSQKYWTGARMAPEIIDAMNAFLDSEKRLYHLPGYALTGYSGGGGAAVLLAERRGDVASLRTVAGNIDQGAFNAVHRLAPAAQSLNPEDKAAALAAIPQLHVSGADDGIVPPAIARSFAGKEGPQACIVLRVMPGMTHSGDWAALWPGLLSVPLPCAPLSPHQRP